jgi:predicted dinucleotide-binding enzyme
MKKIGILGSGAVGITLANGFIKHGYQAILATNNSTKHEDLKKKLDPEVAIGTFFEAAEFGDTLVLAVKGSAAEEVLKSVSGFLDGKTVMDATNPIAPLPPVNGVLQFFTGPNDSLMEKLQLLFPSANFVKVFNSVGSGFMVNPDFGGEKPSMFICGNSDEAKQEVTNLLTQFGWDTEDMGKVEAARAIEPLCMLWCIPGFLNNQWSHAFRLMKK